MNTKTEESKETYIIDSITNSVDSFLRLILNLMQSRQQPRNSFYLYEDYNFLFYILETFKFRSQSIRTEVKSSDNWTLAEVILTLCKYLYNVD